MEAAGCNRSAMTDYQRAPMYVDEQRKQLPSWHRRKLLSAYFHEPINSGRMNSGNSAGGTLTRTWAVTHAGRELPPAESLRSLRARRAGTCRQSL